MSKTNLTVAHSTLLFFVLCTSVLAVPGLYGLCRILVVLERMLHNSHDHSQHIADWAMS